VATVATRKRPLKPSGAGRIHDGELELLRDAPLIEPGEYDAIATGKSRTITMFGKVVKLAVEFKVYPLGLGRPDVFHLLIRYYRVATKDGRFGAGPNSDFARELQAFTGQKVRRRDRLSPSAFANAIARVEVKTVTDDRNQRPLHPTCQYSVVRRVLGRKDPQARTGVLAPWPRGTKNPLPAPDLKGRIGREGTGTGRTASVTVLRAVMFSKQTARPPVQLAPRGTDCPAARAGDRPSDPCPHILTELGTDDMSIETVPASTVLRFTHEEDLADDA
jgi:hypothetical protein